MPLITMRAKFMEFLVQILQLIVLVLILIAFVSLHIKIDYWQKRIGNKAFPVTAEDIARHLGE